MIDWIIKKLIGSYIDRITALEAKIAEMEAVWPKIKE